MQWYKVNDTNLPEINFVCDDMRNHLDSNSDREQLLRKGADPKEAYGNILKLNKSKKPITINFQQA